MRVDLLLPPTLRTLCVVMSNAPFGGAEFRACDSTSVTANPRVYNMAMAEKLKLQAVTKTTRRQRPVATKIA